MRGLLLLRGTIALHMSIFLRVCHGMCMGFCAVAISTCWRFLAHMASLTWSIPSRFAIALLDEGSEH